MDPTQQEMPIVETTKPENQISYRVLCDNNILLESPSKQCAENFVSSLAQSTQKNVSIVTVTGDGLQVLLG